jgi:hypothetical protein
MQRWLAVLCVSVLLLPSAVLAQRSTQQPPAASYPTVQEVDGSPTGKPKIIKVTNGTLTDNGDGSFTISTGGGGSITIQEVDGTPSGTMTTLKVTNGTLTDDGGGTFTLVTGGGGGSGTVSSGTAGRVTYYPSTGTTVDDSTGLTLDGTSITRKVENITASSSSMTLGAHNTIACDASGAARTYTLPAASGVTLGQVYRVIKVDSSGNTCTVAPATGERLNGAVDAVKVIAAQNEDLEVILVSAATPNWQVTGTVIAPLSVSLGGTGATTLTGLVLGNGTSAMTGVTTLAGLNTALTDADLLPDPGSNGLVARTGATTTANRTISAGAGLAGSNLDGVSGNPTLTTASGEADFLASGVLTCGAATQGKMQVHTTPLQYCDNAGTPTLRYSAYGDSAGAATSVANDSVALGTKTTGNYVGDVTAGAGLSKTSSASEGQTVDLAVASTEANFLTDGGASDLTCGGSNQGKAQVMDNGDLQYCDGATTSVLRKAALQATTVTVAGTANEITSSAGAQDLSANRTWTLSIPATFDLSGKTATAPIKAGTSAATPGTCIASKELYIKTDATAGQQLFLCNGAGNGFNLVGDGGAGSALADPGGNGVVVRTAANTTINRTLTGTANQVSISNGDGVSGNPTFSVPSSAQLSVAKLTNLTSNGFVKTSGGDGTLSVDTATYSTASSSDTLTNKTLDVEGTGNSITTVSKIWLPAVGCAGTTGSLLWDTLATNAPTATCSAGSTETTMMRGVADFPDSDGDYSLQQTISLPDDWTGAIDAKVKYRTTATSGNTVWQLTTACRADAEVDDVAYNTATAFTADAAKGTTNQLNDATATGIVTTGCAAGELMHLKLFRNRTHASDTITGVVSFVGLELTMRRAQ